MKKISFAAFGVVFGGLVVGGADASIISRGFLDEALESYATTTALDLKADKADLTALSDKIRNAWPYMFDMAPGLRALSYGLYPQEMNLENTSDLVRFLFGGQIESGINEAGVLNILGQSVVDAGAYDVKTGQIDDGFRSLTQLTNGWTDSQKKTYLGVKGLNDTLLWPTSVKLAEQTYAAELFGFDRNVSYAAGTTIKDVLSNMFVPTSSDYAHRPNFYEVGNRIFNGGLVLTDRAKEISGLTEYKGLYDLTKDIGTLYDLTKDIGTLPEGITVQGMYEGWISPVTGKHTLGLSAMEQDYFTAYNPTTDSFQEAELGKGGLLYLLDSLLTAHGYADGEDNILAPFWKLTQSAYKTDELSTKIGRLPSGAMPEAPGWDALLFLMNQESGIKATYPTSLAGLMELLIGNTSLRYPGILQFMYGGFPAGDIDGDGEGDVFGIYPNYYLAKEANDKIGTLPEGITVQGMYEGWMSPSGIQTAGLSQVELDSFLVYNPRTDSAQNVEGLKGGLLHILKTMMSYGDYSPTYDEWRLAPFWKLTQSAYKTDELSTKIGTLPTGELPRVNFWTDTLLPALGIEPNYPTSLAGLMELLFGNNAHAGILPLIYRGVTVDTDGNGGKDTNIGILSNYSLATSANATANAASTAAQTAQTTANTAKSTADSAIEKIGRLPTEYSTVGAALSAMDAKIDAHELPADSDDGQYVLSAKKVGDTITYTWVKMDLTDAEK